MTFEIIDKGIADSALGLLLGSKQFEAPDYMTVKNGMLYNTNTRKYEGVDGDGFILTVNGETIEGTVNGYTDYQVIRPKGDNNTMVLSADGLANGTTRVEYIHTHRIKKV